MMYDSTFVYHLYIYSDASFVDTSEVLQYIVAMATSGR